MKKVRVLEATGVLAELLAENREKELMHTRKRMMLAVKIADAMRNIGYSQKEFAIKMEKSETVISEWLSGERNFTVDTLADIEEALGIRLLDVTVMTIINASLEIQQNISLSTKKPKPINQNASWGLNTSVMVCNSNAKCA